MKMRFLILFAVCFLVACTPKAEVYVPPTPDLSATDTANQIATVIAEKATAVAVEASYTSTPTPKPVTLRDLVLTSEEANELANRWSDTPLDDTQSVNPDYCKLECTSFTWEGGVEGNSLLDITMFKLGSRDEASTVFGELKAQFLSGTAKELTLPELVTLPADTFIFDAQSNTGKDARIWGLLTREGAVIVLIGLDMPDLSADENMLFLSLYADRQIQKLIAVEK